MRQRTRHRHWGLLPRFCTTRLRADARTGRAAIGRLPVGFDALLWLALVLTSVSTAACGDGEPKPVPEPLPIPVTLTHEQRGLGVYPGDGPVITQTNKGAELDGAFKHLVIRRQLVDELILSREGVGAINDAKFPATVETLKAEIEAARSVESLVVVLDLMRLSDGSKANSPIPYLTTWDQNERDPDRFGFWRNEYREAVLEAVTTTATEQHPQYFVVGADMERFLTMEGGANDYANFVTLYREAYAAIKVASPSTKVGAGINWVRFQLDVVPTMTLLPYEYPEGVELTELAQVSCATLQGTEEEVALLQAACTQKAFAQYIEPLLHFLAPVQSPDPAAPPEEPVYVTTADIIGLAARPNQGDFNNTPALCPATFFDGLRGWSQDFPVVYYEVNWQISSAVGFGKQDEWLTTLIERNLGVQVEVLAWATLKDLLSNDCGKMTNDLGAPDYVCFSGLWKDSSAPKEVYETLMTDIVPE